MQVRAQHHVSARLALTCRAPGPPLGDTKKPGSELGGCGDGRVRSNRATPEVRLRGLQWAPALQQPERQAGRLEPGPRSEGQALCSESTSTDSAKRFPRRA